MENLISEKVERIMDLVEWFEEFQPNDLEQIERIMLGLKYVDEDVIKSNLRQDLYRIIKLTKLDKYLELDYEFIYSMFASDLNERRKNK